MFLFDLGQTLNVPQYCSHSFFCYPVGIPFTLILGDVILSFLKGGEKAIPHSFRNDRVEQCFTITSLSRIESYIIMYGFSGRVFLHKVETNRAGKHWEIHIQNNTPFSPMGLPQAFISRLESIYGEKTPTLISAFTIERMGFFRVNHIFYKGGGLSEEIANEFLEKNIHVIPFDEAKGIYTYDKQYEYAMKGTQAFYTGKIYLQGISSMLPVFLLDPQPGERVLDVCAAPGSKTTLMSALMHNSGSIRAIEQNSIRMEKLRFNARLQGAENIECIKMDALKFLLTDYSLYERILLDAPCSAEGRISLANEKSYGFWSLENITRKSELQYQLLSLSVAHLRPGGTCVYSTCTLAPEENEGVISRILDENRNLSLVDITANESFDSRIDWIHGIRSFAGSRYHPDIVRTVRIIPNMYAEGFFIAKIQKSLK